MQSLKSLKPKCWFQRRMVAVVATLVSFYAVSAHALERARSFENGMMLCVSYLETGKEEAFQGRKMKPVELGYCGGESDCFIYVEEEEIGIHVTDFADNQMPLACHSPWLMSLSKRAVPMSATGQLDESLATGRLVEVSARPVTLEQPGGFKDVLALGHLPEGLVRSFEGCDFNGQSFLLTVYVGPTGEARYEGKVGQGKKEDCVLLLG